MELVYRWADSSPQPGGPAGAAPPAEIVSTLRVVVTAVQTKGGVTTVTLAETLGEQDQGSDTFEVSEKGVFVTRTDAPAADKQGWKHDPPLCVLSLPHKPGNKWIYECRAQPGGLVGVKATKTAHGPEELVVPAGKFTAIRVEHRDIDKDGREALTATFWYAPEVGLVKMVSRDVVQELKSITNKK
jgi:hypothetical protein